VAFEASEACFSSHPSHGQKYILARKDTTCLIGINHGSLTLIKKLASDCFEVRALGLASSKPALPLLVTTTYIMRHSWLSKLLLLPYITWWFLELGLTHCKLKHLLRDRLKNIRRKSLHRWGFEALSRHAQSGTWFPFGNCHVIRSVDIVKFYT
jgi:hypothetical protein